MNIKDMDKFKRVVENMVSELNTDELINFIEKNNDSFANSILEKTLQCVDLTGPDRYKKITLTMGVFFSMICSDPCYRDQIFYFLTMVKHAYLPGELKKPENWRVNNLGK